MLCVFSEHGYCSDRTHHPLGWLNPVEVHRHDLGDLLGSAARPQNSGLRGIATQSSLFTNLDRPNASPSPQVQDPDRAVIDVDTANRERVVPSHEKELVKNVESIEFLLGMSISFEASTMKETSNSLHQSGRDTSQVSNSRSIVHGPSNPVVDRAAVDCRTLIVNIVISF